ncbi:hypothetical protein BV898_05568 [Hypsibius exemplaris]|uniref:Vacuolar ATPase assembly integral membrane protein VMA21 homolog n=1 Tax=Hypsibius exemplaris TaxID=2072580 RepID=A0A1W0WZ99_HYPEX|nr:hypothetical protein BV898_05568 [Hypsibius exemplaris]
MASIQRKPAAATPGTATVVHENRSRDLSPDKHQDQAPDKRAQKQAASSEEDVLLERLLKKAPRDASPDKRQKQLSTVSDQEVTSIFKTLTMYTLLIIFMPILSYFFARKYIFEDLLGFDARQSFIYWAVLAVVSIHVVLFIMVYRAYQDGVKPRTIKQD